MIFSDVPAIASAFENSRWIIKEADLFEEYLSKQAAGLLAIWIACSDQQYAGYVTLSWKSQYSEFHKKDIPEIMDLNVLPEFRRKGIGTKLIQTAEQEAATQSNIVGMGTGLYADYGSAQKLYVELGYKPDGNGATWQYKSVQPGAQYPIDDDLLLWFTKSLLS